MNGLIRILAISIAGMTYGWAIANLIVSFKVLRPRPWTWQSFKGSGGGFIWLHIVCVVIPFQGFVTWGIWEVISRSHQPLTFRPVALFFLCAIINLGYVIIYRVELARLRIQQTGVTNLTRRATDLGED